MNGKTWQYIFDGPKDESGERHQITKSGYATKRQAEAALRRAIAQAEIDAESGASSGSPPLGEWLEKSWLPSRRRLRRSTRASYEGIIRNHIMLDPIAAIGIASVTAADLDSLLTRISRKPGKAAGTELSAKTLKNIYRVLKGAFDAAVDQGVVQISPLSRVEEPRPAKRKIEVWSPLEIRRFLDSVRASSPHMEPLYQLALATGMRRGELAGLQWPYVNLDAGTIRVEETRLYADGAVYDAEPKTKSSRRTITLGANAVAALQRARSIQLSGAKALDGDWVDSGHVFTKASGQPLNPDYISQRFRRDVDRSGVRRIKFHGMRHTFATNTLAAGGNPKALSEILGHTDVQTTLSLYAQFLPGVHRDTINAAEAQLFGYELGPMVINPVIADATTEGEREETPGKCGSPKGFVRSGGGI